MPEIRQKINRKKDCFLEYKIIDFNIILRDSPYMFNNKKESRNMTQQIQCNKCDILENENDLIETFDNQLLCSPCYIKKEFNTESEEYDKI